MPCMPCLFVSFAIARENPSTCPLFTKTVRRHAAPSFAPFVATTSLSLMITLRRSVCHQTACPRSQREKQRSPWSPIVQRRRNVSLVGRPAPQGMMIASYLLLCFCCMLNALPPARTLRGGDSWEHPPHGRLGRSTTSPDSSPLTLTRGSGGLLGTRG
jgi:hypothetical protein